MDEVVKGVDGDEVGLELEWGDVGDRFERGTKPNRW